MPRQLKPLEVPTGQKPSLQVAFAQILRERRLALGLAQADFQDDDKYNHAYISKLELGQQQVCLNGFVHIARKLKMEPSDLMGEIVKKAGQ